MPTRQATLSSKGALSSPHADSTRELDGSAREEPVSFLFNRQVKRRLVPQLTDCFQLSWPWPSWRTLHDATLAADGASLSAPTGRTSEHETSTSASHLSDSELSWHQRRYRRPTIILGLTSDPVIGGLDTRRVGLLLGDGPRFKLPLVVLQTPEEHPDGKGRNYWSLACPTTPPSSGGVSAVYSTGTASCAELVVGELAAIEFFAKERQAQARDRDMNMRPPCLANVKVTPRSPSDRAPRKRMNGPPLWSTSRHSSKPIQTYTLFSTPYKMLWLPTLPGRLMVSLPCEERLITCYAPHAPAGDPLPARLSIREVHTFFFPRGVVPLDLAELGDHACVAVGTYEHGVWLYRLDRLTGAVEGIVQRVSLSGVGSSLFPVTKLGIVLPPRSHSASSAGYTASLPAAWQHHPWGHDAAALASLPRIALLCSSIYEPFSILVKLSSGGDGDVENFSASRPVESLLHVGSTMDPDVGMLAVTTGRKVVRLVQLPDGGAGLPLVGVSAVSERAPPAVGMVPMYRMPDVVLTRVMDGPPVYQFIKHPQQQKNSRYAHHWMVCADANNRLHLLDRTYLRYVTHSLITLQPASLDGMGISMQTAGSAGSAVTSSSAPQQTTVPTARKSRAGKRRNRSSTEASRSPSPPPPTTAAVNTVLEPPLEALSTGVVLLLAGNGWIRVAAAHDDNWLSVVTWAAS